MSKIYNIPLHKSFLNEVAIFIKNLKDSGFNAAEYIVFLPNRRSCRELKHLVLEKYGDDSAILPKIKSISDEFLFDDNKIILHIISLLKENLKNKNISINTLFELAKNVVSLIKELILNDVDLKNLKDIVPHHFSEYWNHTISILHGCMEHQEVKKIIQIAQIQFSFFVNSIEEKHEKIIAAGIGITNNYIKKFLKSVLASENGVIFFIGSEKKESQNQYANKKSIAFLNKNFDSIDYFCNSKNCVTFSEFPNMSEEAFAVSAAVREAVFEKKSILIVASDIVLSKKIKSELLRWNIKADDSIGEKFSETQIGIIISSVVDTIYYGLRTSDVLNILKLNPNYNSYILEMELFFRKQHRVPLNFSDAVIFWYKNKENNRLCKLDFNCIQDFLKKFLNLYKSKKEFYNDIKNNCSRKFIDWFYLSLEFIVLISFEAAEQFKNIAGNFIKNSYLLGEMTFDEFKVFLINHVISISVRISKGHTEGVVILGMIEAQLLDADIVIIAGANENSMTSSEKNNFWMSKSMLSALNIQTIESKNQFIRCVFERLVNKPIVLITRSKTVSGIQQPIYSYLEKTIKESKNKGHIKGDLHYIYDLENFVKCFYWNFKHKPLEFTPPNPKLLYRPNKFSATDIELLANNPYAFYAKKILHLKKINNINDIKNIKGIFIHEVLSRFIKEHSSELTVDKLNIVVENLFKNKWLGLNDFGIWFFKLKNIITFFIKNISKDTTSFTEKKGECVIDIFPNYAFTIFCIADRIDLLKDNTMSIIDYKTGIIPSIKQVKYGYKPQLPIEAIIAKNDGFQIGKTNVSSLLFWSLNGIEEGGKIYSVTAGLADTEELIDKALNGLRNLISQYNVLGIPYNVNLNYDYDQEYAHLARVKEWHDA